MLGHAITTELQLLAAREHAADLAGVFASRGSDSTRDEVVRSGGARPEPGTTPSPCLPTLAGERNVWKAPA